MATPWTITVDCADAHLLAEFWSAALGYAPAPPPTGFATWEACWSTTRCPPTSGATSPRSATRRARARGSRSCGSTSPAR
ncbi:VOC family protein [Pseudonocardia sp. ICBG601]|uniref:VOC family protein n=1 Tax=Pseudonocardia sp. ICBG601 TaxID=2846759 RepID=UPI0021F60B30|nr:VOC family protein [Pseudonocardia sp. ICBG601]